MPYEEVGPDRFRCTETGAVHVCTAAECDARFVNRDCTATCSITGRCFEQIMAEHPFEATVKRTLCPREVATAARPQRRKRRRNPFAAKKTKAHFASARDTVHRLLFSPLRAELNEKKRQRMLETVQRRVRRQAREGASKGAVDAIVAEEQARLRRVPCAELSPADMRDRAEGYARGIVACWALMGRLPYGQQHQANLHFDSHVLGMLYTAQHGLVVGDTRVMRRDAFLFRMLPPIHDLKAYGFSRRLITVGKNHMKRALAGASEGDLKALRAGVYNCPPGPGAEDNA